MEIRLRSATDVDEAFLVDVYASTREEELALTGWDQSQRDAFVRMQFDAQQLHYRKHYPSGEQLLIVVDDDKAGRLYLARLPDQIRILDMTILPGLRSRGIGTRILQDLMAEARHANKPLRIYVESYNRSLGLFERLGFARSGAIDESHLLLEWRPGTA